RRNTGLVGAVVVCRGIGSRVCGSAAQRSAAATPVAVDGRAVRASVGGFARRLVAEVVGSAAGCARAARPVARAMGVRADHRPALRRMDSATVLGTSVIRDVWPICRLLPTFGLLLAFTAPASATDRYAVIITGASGGPAYAQKYDKIRTSFVTT